MFNEGMWCVQHWFQYGTPLLNIDIVQSMEQHKGIVRYPQVNIGHCFQCNCRHTFFAMEMSTPCIWAIGPMNMHDVSWSMNPTYTMFFLMKSADTLHVIPCWHTQIYLCNVRTFHYTFGQVRDEKPGCWFTHLELILEGRKGNTITDPLHSSEEFNMGRNW